MKYTYTYSFTHDERNAIVLALEALIHENEKLPGSYGSNVRKDMQELLRKLQHEWEKAL